jgi:hypothetical protein
MRRVPCFSIPTAFIIYYFIHLHTVPERRPGTPDQPSAREIASSKKPVRELYLLVAEPKVQIGVLVVSGNVQVLFLIIPSGIAYSDVITVKDAQMLSKPKGSDSHLFKVHNDLSLPLDELIYFLLFF